MATMYYVIADDLDCPLIGFASTLKEAKKIISEDAAQFAEVGCSMNYSIIKGERITYDVTPHFKFDFEEREG
uniref:Uncharacterized protein n=1 Tax=Siphoviridae sp. ctZHD14 TaxID=2827891 RepID=A0A8S5SWG1_9CAUD|nr:MAG TPA: hypothetical protein [Siphoviridae sp. ctZHD14]